MAPQVYPVTLLDANQVLQYVYDETTQTLRTNSTATIIVGDITVDIDGIYSGLNLDPDNIGLIAHVRALTPIDSDQTVRVTSVSNLDAHSLDVALHNSDGSEIDGINPLTVSGTITTSPDVNIHDAAGNNLTSQMNGSQRALDVGIDVAGIQVDPRQIRPLTNADVITSQQGTSPWVDNISQYGGSAVLTGTGNSGAGIPRVTVSDDSSLTVNNGAGVDAVNIQDGGNSITVDGSVIANVSNLPVAVDTNFGVVGASTIRTAAEIGNSTGAADFNFGNTTVQTLRVKVADDQLSFPIDNYQLILSNNTLTISGSLMIGIDTTQYKEFTLSVRIDGPVTGISPTLQFTLSDLDGFGVAVTGNQTLTPIYTGAIAAQEFTHYSLTGKMQLNWTITGTTPSFSGVYAAINGVKDAILLGQATMAASSPVVIASDQTPIPVIGSITTSPNVNIHDAAGNNLTSQVNGAQRALDVGIDVAGVQIDPRQVRALTAADVVTANQGTSPWVVSGTVTTTQGTSPWVDNISQFGGSAVVTGTGNSGLGIPRVTVSNDSSIKLNDGTDTALITAAGELNVLATAQPGIDIGDVTVNNASGAAAVNIQDGGNSITVDGTVATTQGTSPWVVSGTVAVTQSTSPWVDNISQFGGSNVVTGIGNSGAGIPRVTVSSDSSITNITGMVSLPTGAATAALQTQPGVDIGDVTVNNAPGAAAVNIQDGGNSITVDGTVTANAGTGTFTTQDTSSLVDNAPFTDGTSRVLPVGYIFDEVAGTALTENDVAAARLDSKRAQVLVIEDATTRGQRTTVTAANALKVDGSAVTQPISGTVSVTQATASNLNAEVQGDAASGSAKSGNPVQTGSVFNTTQPTVSTGQVVENQATARGALIVATGVDAFTVGLPSGASTAANQTTEIASLQILDDVPAANNAAFSKGNPIMGQLDDTGTVVATEDNVSVARITAQRALHTNLRNTAGTEVGTSGAPLRIDPTGSTTQPISAASLPLPSGASTSALQTQPGVDIGDVTVNNASGAAAVNIQDGGNSITVDGTITANQGTSPWVENVSQFGGSAVVTGTGNGGAGIPRVTVSNDSSITNITGTVSLPTGAATSALQTTGNASLTSIDGKLNSLGQKTMVASVPVVIASNQTSIPVASTPVAPSALFNNIVTVTTAGTRVQLSVSSVPILSVVIRALTNNTPGIIYVGNSTVAAANGYPLRAGDVLTIDIDNLNKVYIDSSTNGISINYLAS